MAVPNDIPSQNTVDRAFGEPVPSGPEFETVVRSEALFASKTEIVIVHNGERYRLRLTRRGKLILQK